MNPALPQPSFRTQGLKILFGRFSLYLKSVKREVEDAEVQFGPADAGKWFYIQLVHFQGSNEIGYHVTDGPVGAMPVLAVATSNTETLCTVASGKVNQSGTGFEECYLLQIPTRLLVT